MATIGKDIDLTSGLLKANRVVGLPTETVYGLAGNALSEEALLEIYRVKNRPSFNPLIAHTDSLDKIRPFVKHIPSQIKTLADAFWPGPLTVLFDKNDLIPDLLTSGLSRVAFRIPNHPLTLDLLGSLDFPLAAPSANPFGYVSPVTANHVNDQLGDHIPYILDGGDCTVGIESTIIGYEDSGLVVYRPGGTSLEAIEEIVGEVKVRLNQSTNPATPGMLKSHYSPSKRLKVMDLASIPNDSNEKAVISYRKDYGFANQFILTPGGDLNEAARNLFKALRYLDTLPITEAWIEWMPDEGPGKAINDRIRRAVN